MRAYPILFAVLAGCSSLEKPKLDPCAAMPDGTCFAVPVDQPGKPSYERSIRPGDICITADEFAARQKYELELIKRCGEKCK